MPSLSKDDLIYEAWARGILRYKLKPHQRGIYTSLWDVINNKLPHKQRTWVVNCSRRYGKTFVNLLVCVEFCLRTENMQVRFAGPEGVQLMKSITASYGVITQDCPEEFRPRFDRQAKVIYFHNGSELHFAGVDNGHAENLRGASSNLNVLDEAAFMDDLEYVYKSVLFPQTLTTGGKTIFVSTPPKTGDHYYTEIYRDHLERDCVSQFTIWDNTELTDEMLQEAIDESGGRETTYFQREYECKFVTEHESVIIPEWNTKYVQSYTKDQYFKYYHRYVAMDIGGKDLTAVIFGHYDFRTATLHISDEFHTNGPTMTTDVLAKDIKDKEAELWPGEKPRLRIADNNNMILLNDMAYMHQMPFVATSKDSLEAMVNKVRMMVAQGRVTIDPKCTMLIGALQYGIWSKSKTKREFSRSKKYGHYDHLAALIYLIRNLDEVTNPIPVLHNISERTHWINPEVMQNTTNNAVALKKALGIKRKPRPL